MRRSKLLLAVVAFSPLVHGGAARGQGVVTLDRPTGEVGVGFDGAWFDFPQAEGSTVRTFQGWIQLRLSGAVFDPRLVNFSLGLRPLQAQTNWTGPPRTASGDVDGFIGSAALNLFSGAPVTLQARALRTAQNNRDRFGVETDVNLTEWGGHLTYRNTYLPLELDYSDRARDVRWRLNPEQGIRQDQRIQTLRLTARNSKTRASAERLAFDDRVGENDFTTYRARADHQLRWGKRSSLASAFQYLDRTGAGAYDRVYWAQRAHLQHTWRIYSDYGYGLFSQDVAGQGTSGWTGRVGMTYEILPSLQVGAQWYGQSTRFEVARQTIHRLGPRVAFTIPVPLNAQLRATVSVGYERQDVKPSDDGFVMVVNERHVVDQSGRFLLDETLADAASVVITDVDETTIFEAGFDYRVVESDVLVEILVLPGGRIQAGDTLLVDYRFRILPESSFDALISDYDLNLRLGWISVYHRRSVRDELGDGDARVSSLLLNYDDMTTGVALQIPTAIGSVSLLAEQRRRESRSFDFTNYLFRAGVLFRVVSQLRGTVVANLRQRRDGGVPFDLFSAETGLDWSATRWLRLRADLTAWKWSQDPREQTFIGGGVGADWRIGLSNLGLRYDRFVWKDGLDRTEDRLLGRIARRF